MRRLVVGVIGHVDHGKTALVRALTGIETDRLPEEKRRGISIALGFAHFGHDGTAIDLIDMPGHERFVRTMIAGATGIDAVLLVVDAREGVKPQTAEHVAIAGLLGIADAVLAVSKCDLVTEAEALAVAQDAAGLLRRAGLSVSGPALTSASESRGLDTLRRSLSRVAARTEPRAERGFAWLPIDRAFSIAGHGTVVTGTLRCGRLSGTDVLELLPENLALRVRGLQVHRTTVPAALPGQRVAVNLRGVGAAALRRGQALATPGIVHSARWIGVGLRSLPDAPSLRSGAILTLLAGSDECEARLRLLDREALEPGGTCVAQLHCAAGVAVPPREPFVLRATAPQATVGGGRVLDTASGRLRRREWTRLQRLAEGTPAELALREVLAAKGGCSLLSLSLVCGLAPARVRAALGGAPVRMFGDWAFAEAAVERFGAQAARALAEAPGGLGRERLLAFLPRRLPPEVGDALLDAVCKRGRIGRDGGIFRIREPDRERTRAVEEHDLGRRIEALLLRAKLSPPDASTLFGAHPGARAAITRLVRDGVVIRAMDRVQKREILFHRQAIQEAKAALASHLARPPGLLLGEAASLLGITRKYAVPLMEHLDAAKFTRRVADRRVLARSSPEPGADRV